MNNLYEERWSQDIKSIINCEEIIFKTYKQKIVEITLKSKLFIKDLLMGDTVKSADTLGEISLPNDFKIMKSEIKFKKYQCFLLRMSDEEEILVLVKERKWVELKE